MTLTRRTFPMHSPDAGFAAFAEVCCENPQPPRPRAPRASQQRRKPARTRLGNDRPPNASSTRAPHTAGRHLVDDGLSRYRHDNR